MLEIQQISQPFKSQLKFPERIKESKNRAEYRKYVVET